MLEILFVGLTTVDLTYFGVTLPAPGTKAQATSTAVAVGGPSANAAIAAASLGAKSVLCSTLGSSALAAFARAELRAEGVYLLDDERAGQVPVSSVFIGTDGARSVVSANGADSEPVAPPGLIAEAANASVVLVDGHYPTLALPALKAARAAGTTTMIDLGSWKPTLPSLLPHCDVAIASADFTVPDGDVFETVTGFGVPFVAVSRGPQPISWQTLDGEHGEIPVPAVEAVATNGAGDILHGAYAFFHAQGSDHVAALARAAKVASASCSEPAARIPSLARLSSRGGLQ